MATNPLSSLTARCLSYTLVYAAILIALFAAVNAAADAQIRGAFPSMEDVLEHESDLEGDQFNALSGSEFSRCQILVFDDDGTRLYASSREIASKISAEDLPIINDYEDRNRYEVFEEQNADGVRSYRIVLYSYDSQDHMRDVRDYCILDEDLNIVEGTLFPGRQSLQEREFSLIKGFYEPKMTVEKYTYDASGDQGRTLVLVSPVVSEWTYNQMVDETGRLWLIAVPVAIAATALIAILMVRMIRRSISPLNKAILARKNHEDVPTDNTDLPADLRPIFDNFIDLVQKLDASQQEKQRMIADVSHDLKTPLTVIRGYAKAFYDGRVPDNKKDLYLQAMNDKSLIASELLDTLFEYAQMEHPEYQADRKDIDLYESIRKTVIDVFSDVEQAGCSLVVNLPDESMHATLDERLFQRMLRNLINNAYQHNPRGTTIYLSCGRTRTAAEITVADDGLGLPDDIAGRAFDPFVTGNSARASGQGTGLGLAIARRSAELNGGTIRISDHPRAPYHTEIKITLPLRQA